MVEVFAYASPWGDAGVAALLPEQQCGFLSLHYIRAIYGNLTIFYSPINMKNTGIHLHDLTAWTQSHVFDEGNPIAEKSTQAVLIITLVMMVIEIAAGKWFNSMALLADGWHMSSHAVAIGLSMFAYKFARHYANDARFAFGTWKIEVLAGFASALLLLVIAVFMSYESVLRLTNPQPIHFIEAIVVAAIGLAVNLLCAFILGKGHHHHHEHDHATSHRHHADLNLKSAYIHVLADAATSVFAIVALLGGYLLGLNWLDPVMGIVGAIVIALWARGLITETSRVLLDCEMDRPLITRVKHIIESNSPWAETTRIVDLHIWRIGKAQYACIISLVTTDRNITSAQIKPFLQTQSELTHITIEVNYLAHA